MYTPTHVIQSLMFGMRCPCSCLVKAFSSFCPPACNNDMMRATLPLSEQNNRYHVIQLQQHEKGESHVKNRVALCTDCITDDHLVNGIEPQRGEGYWVPLLCQWVLLLCQRVPLLCQWVPLFCHCSRCTLPLLLTMSPHEQNSGCHGLLRLLFEYL